MTVIGKTHAPGANKAFNIFSLLVASTLIGGCIHFDRSMIDEPVKPVRTLAQRTCCDSLLEMEVHSLPANKYQTLVIDETDAVLEFRTGKSFAKVVELPSINTEYLLQVDSVVNRPEINLIPRALYPMVTLLDEKLDTVAIFDQERVDLRKPLFGPDLLRITLTIDSASEARYALIHTSERRADQGLTNYAPFEIVERKSFDSILYSRPTDSRHKIHFANIGMVSLLAAPIN